MKGPYRCCRHCERNDEGVCVEAPNGTDTHVVGCLTADDEPCPVGNERVEVTL